MEFLNIWSGGQFWLFMVTNSLLSIIAKNLEEKQCHGSIKYCYTDNKIQYWTLLQNKKGSQSLQMKSTVWVDGTLLLISCKQLILRLINSTREMPGRSNLQVPAKSVLISSTSGMSWMAWLIFFCMDVASTCHLCLTCLLSISQSSNWKQPMKWSDLI